MYLLICQVRKRAGGMGKKALDFNRAREKTKANPEKMLNVLSLDVSPHCAALFMRTKYLASGWQKVTCVHRASERSLEDNRGRFTMAP